MATQTAIPAPVVAAQVIKDGGSPMQAWVAAALVSGIESNGQPDDKNPTSTASGLFQYLDTTWASEGGTQYAPTAGDASWQDQVAVFTKNTQGNNFYPWAPDLGGSYDGKPISAPKAGSPVANKISDLASGGTLAFLGNVPTGVNDPSGGGATGANPFPGPVGAVVGTLTGGSSTDPLADAASSITSVDGLITAITSVSFWDRIGMGALGVFMIVVGGIIFFASTNTGKKTTSEAAEAAPLLLAA